MRKLSVVSLWYNQAAFLPRFVAALRAQTFQDFEAVFVDNGSAEPLEGAVAEACRGAAFEWRYVQREAQPFALNSGRNCGLAMARADRVLFMDGDMLPLKQLLERHVRNLTQGATCSVGSRIRAPYLGVASDERYHIFTQGRWREKPFLYAFGCNLAVDKYFLDRHRLRFDESYDGQYGLDDIDFAYRCHKAGAVFWYDVYAAAMHVPVDHPDLKKLSQSLESHQKFHKYHFVTGIVQSGPVFFEHRYNAELYRQLLGGGTAMGADTIKITVRQQQGADNAIIKEIGRGRPTFIIAEAGLNHNGSFELAKKMVEVAALAGADCVKFQKRDVDQMATKTVYDNTPTPVPELGETYREVRERHELSVEELKELKRLAERLGLLFMITPFDQQSVDVCEEVGQTCYKIASHSMTDLPTLRKVAALKKPLFISTGMSTQEEVDIAVKTIREYHDQFVLMHCVSSYPQKSEDSNLNLVDYLWGRYQCLVGYSGHEQGTIITAAAVLKGVAAVERHFTLDKGMPGFDHWFSLSPQELFEICQQIRTLEKALGTPEKRVLASEMRARTLYRRSLVTALPLKRGQLIEESHLTVKEPGTGIAPYMVRQVIGKHLATDLEADVTLEWTHLVS